MRHRCASRRRRPVELADRGGANALKLYEQAANAYIELWRTYGEEPIAARQPTQCEKMRRGRLQRGHAPSRRRASIAKAIQARARSCINPQNTMDKTRARQEGGLRDRRELPGHRGLRRGGRTGTRSTRKENPKGENADKALSDATLLRLGLGQEDEAIKDGDAYNQALRQHEAGADGGDRVRVSARTTPSKEDWDKARKRLSGAMALIERSATFDVRRPGARDCSAASTSKSEERQTKREGRVRQGQGSVERPKAAESKIMALRRGRRLRRSGASARR